jgi:hypothetical protein
MLSECLIKWNQEETSSRTTVRNNELEIENHNVYLNCNFNKATYSLKVKDVEIALFHKTEW